MSIRPLLLISFIAVSFFAACTSENRKFVVVGNINGMPVQTVVLEQISNDVISIVDSERSKEDGHFEVSGISPQPGLYRLRFQPNKFILLSVDKGNIRVAADWNSLENYTVTGSVPSENLKGFLAAVREHLRFSNSMGIVFDTLQARGNDSMLMVARKNFQDKRMQFTQYVERYADTTPYEPNAIFAARILNPATESTYLAAFAQSLNHRFPGTKMTREYLELYARTVAKPQQPAAAPVEIGAAAPELSLATPDGKTVALSSLRGKYVLLDFWASWCGPCRGENPNVVAAYEKFKDKNFTIYGVSLDNNKDAWQKAITDDNLTWTQVSDLKGWASSAAALYSIQSIPSNFLIDPAGKIIARDLRGEDLDHKLEEVLGAKATTANP
jgi:peroxiredoxin